MKQKACCLCFVCQKRSRKPSGMGRHNLNCKQIKMKVYLPVDPATVAMDRAIMTAILVVVNDFKCPLPARNWTKHLTHAIVPKFRSPNLFSRNLRCNVWSHFTPHLSEFNVCGTFRVSLHSYARNLGVLIMLILVYCYWAGTRTRDLLIICQSRGLFLHVVMTSCSGIVCR